MQHIVTSQLFPRLGTLWRRTTVATVVAALALSAGAQGLESYAERVGPPPEDSRSPNVGEPQFGGTLHVAEELTLASFDSVRVPARVDVEANLMVAEGLFAQDVTGTPVPALVESYTVSDDGLNYSFTLRSGVPFHDGQTLSAADAVASLERWLTGGLGGRAAGYINAIEQTGDLSFDVRLSSPWPFLLFTLSVPQSGALFIYPATQIEAAGEGDVGIPIGTGPYRIEEFLADQYLHLVRFDEYVGRAEPPSGFAGGKVAYLDEIFLHYVRDAGVRFAGLQANQYQVAKNVTTDLYEVLEAASNLRPRVSAGAWASIVMNKRQGLMTDSRIREAVLLALDMPPIVAAAGTPQFSQLESSLMPAGEAWYTPIGDEGYLAHDPERARELLAEAGYDGEPVRWLIDPNVESLYNGALVAVPQLEAVGFNIDLRIMDAATLRSTRTDPALWEFFSSSYANRPDPSLLTPLQSGYVGWWDEPRKNELHAALQEETDFQTRYEIWEELTAHFYNYVPMIKLQTMGTLDGEVEHYSGFWRSNSYFYFVNTWLNE